MKTVRILIRRESYEVVVPDNQVILEAAIEADIDPPFSCKSGICTTCRAILKSGKVRMESNEGLSDAELEQGFILTCQSHPLTDDVLLEYA